MHLLNIKTKHANQTDLQPSTLVHNVDPNNTYKLINFKYMEIPFYLFYPTRDISHISQVYASWSLHFQFKYLPNIQHPPLNHP